MKTECVEVTNKELKEKLGELEAFIKKAKPLHDNQGMLMGVLHKTQEIYGYIPMEIMSWLSDRMEIPTAHIYGMATFYNFFSLKPKAEFQIFACKGTACYVGGGARVLEKLKHELKIDVGDVTADRKFGLGITRCLGCCGLSPVMQINEDVYVRMVPEKVPQILAKYKKKK